MAEIQPKNHQNVQKTHFLQKVPEVNGLKSLKITERTPLFYVGKASHSKLVYICLILIFVNFGNGPHTFQALHSCKYCSVPVKSTNKAFSVIYKTMTADCGLRTGYKTRIEGRDKTWTKHCGLGTVFRQAKYYGWIKKQNFTSWCIHTQKVHNGSIRGHLQLLLSL